MLSTARRILALALLAGLAAAAPAHAAPAVLAYNGTTKIATITIPSADYIEVGGEPGPSGRYTLYSSTDFTITTSNGGSCPVISGGFYQCTPHPVRTVVTGSPDADTIIGLTYATRTRSDYNPDLEVHLGLGDDVVQDGDGNDLIDTGPGNDYVINYLGKDTIDGGPGDDTLTGGEADDVLRGGADRDKLLGGKGNDSLDGGDGPDTVNGEAGNDTLLGGADHDTLLGGDGNDSLDGQGGPDALDGGAGTDTLQGGDRQDLLIGGPGTDALDGGPGGDTVSYEERTAGVTVTLDGQANDGEAGENDAIGNVENVATGSGADHVTGDAGANAVYTGAGDDVVDAGGGADVVETGTGADTVTALDGVLDRVDCGADADVFSGDQLDSVLGCEAATLSRELQPDVDGDGLPLPADCDDRDPARRPGLVDKPGNGIDEDCSGADAPYTRVGAPVLSQFTVRHGRTRVVYVKLLDVPAGAVVEVRCAGGRGRGCFKGVKRRTYPKGAGHAALTKLVKGRRYRRGAVLEVRVLTADQLGKVVRYAMRAGTRQPTPSLRCQVPGAKRPTKC